MGTWGPGIFDNDSALDFLDDVVDAFEHQINHALGLAWRPSTPSARDGEAGREREGLQPWDAWDVTAAVQDTAGAGDAADIVLVHDGRDLVAVTPVAQVELATIDRVVLPCVAILIRLSAVPGDLTVTGGLLERIAADAARRELPSLPDPRMVDALFAWSALPPASQVVRAWRDRVLAVFEAQGAWYGAQAHGEQRMAIDLAFEHLDALAIAAEA